MGSEIFVAGLSNAAERIPQAQLVLVDVRRILYVDDFDVVAALAVIEHNAKNEQVFDLWYRATKPNAGAIISIPQHMWPWNKADEYACHERLFATGEPDGKVRTAGFSIVRNGSFISLLLPLMFSSRLAARNASEYDPAESSGSHLSSIPLLSASSSVREPSYEPRKFSDRRLCVKLSDFRLHFDILFIGVAPRLQLPALSDARWVSGSVPVTLLISHLFLSSPLT